MSDQKPKAVRTLPQSELDLSLMTTDSVWGKEEINPELITRLNRFFKTKTEDGEEAVTVESLWSMLSFYTRDMRLGNLSFVLGEVQYCQYYLDLAHDFLSANMIEPFMTSLSRVATVLELSQSKGGFLRRRQNTITQESSHTELEPPKKALFGGSKKERR